MSMRAPVERREPRYNEKTAFAVNGATLVVVKVSPTLYVLYGVATTSHGPAHALVVAGVS